MISRRTLLLGGVGVVGVGGAGAAGLSSDRVRQGLGLVPDPFVPESAEGRVRVETMRSTALGGTTDLFTAVPAGHGDGAGLPVVIVLHGSSASVTQYRGAGFGFGRFVTAAVERGAPPFVLAGTDDGPAGWVADGSGPDPQRMVVDELPQRLAERGFDADRRVLWGWSRGGYGVLRLVEAHPAFARAAALFSPAVVPPDVVFDESDALEPVPLGLWCGTSDPFVAGVRTLVRDLSEPPEVLTYAPGAHTRQFWNDHTLDMLDWVTGHL